MGNKSKRILGVLLVLSVLSVQLGFAQAREVKADEVRASKFKVFYKRYTEGALILTRTYLSGEIRPADGRIIPALADYFVVEVYDDSKEQVGDSYLSGGLTILLPANLAEKWSAYYEDHSLGQNNVSLGAKIRGVLFTIKDVMGEENWVFVVRKIVTLDTSAHPVETLTE